MSLHLLGAEEPKGPGGRTLTPNELRYTKAFQAFNELVKEFREKNPRWAADINQLVALKDKYLGDYRTFIAANDGEGYDPGIKIVADAQETLLAKARKLLLGLDGKVVDLNDQIKAEAWRAAAQSVVSDAGKAAATVTEPLRKAAEGVGNLGKSLPYLIGGAVLIVGAVAGLAAWRLGPTAGKVAEDVVRRRLGA